MPIERLLGEPVERVERVSGGDIAQSRRVVTTSGRVLFVKLGEGLPAGMLHAEAAGLSALSAGGCRVPEVVAVDDSGLALEWIERGEATRSYWEALGRGLAAQHRITRATAGFDAGDNFIGHTPQPNPDEPDPSVFFRDHRIGHMQRLLRESGRLDAADDAAIDRLRDQIGHALALPDEPPALLHGDLWGGNTMPGPRGEPVLYDPAAHFGCREADLAMTQLFGGFAPAFYAAYEEAAVLCPGYAERVPLYNLYHLLNHAVLFGGGYLAQSMSIVRRLAP
jgi:protein-ribulosamine 3-kinase